MKQSISFDLLVCGAIAGILLSPWLHIAWPFWAPLLLVLGLSSAFFKRLRKNNLHFARLAGLICALLCGISWSLFNAQYALGWKLPDALWRAPSTITVVIDRPVVFHDAIPISRLRIEGRVIDANEDWALPSRARLNTQAAMPRIRLSWFSPDPEANPMEGETWQFVVRARPATSLANQGTRPTQIRLLRDGVRVTGSILSVVDDNGDSVNLRITRGAGPPFRSQVGEAVGSRAAHIDHPKGLHYTAIMTALMNGNRHGMTANQWQTLQHTGVAHVMAISGLHLTLVFGAAWWFFRMVAWLPRGLLPLLLPWLRKGQRSGRQPAHETVALLLALSVAVFYASLAGFAVSTLRALLLISGFVVARVVARRAIPMRILLRCVLCVLIIDPLAWLDAGFWLSVLAVGAIFIWQWRDPTPAHHVRSLRGKLGTLWRLEWMLTLLLIPLSVMYFSGIPWIAPVANLLVLPVFTIIILPACLLAIPFLFSPWTEVGDMFLQVSDIALHAVFYCLVRLEQIPLGWWSTHDHRWGLIPVLWVILRYLPIAWLPRSAVAVMSCIVLMPLLRPQGAHEFAVHMLDVGQGNAMVIQRGRRALIYDTGPAFADGFDAGERVVLPFLRYHQLIPDWMVISHPHLDHAGGAGAIRSAYPAIQTLETRLQPAEIEPGIDRRWPCEWGQVWRWQGVLIRALAPMPGPSFGVNNDSCVLLLTYQGERVLLTGDIQRMTELRMVGRYPDAFSAGILQVPHHGSQTSSQGAFLDRVRPQFALVGTGFLNQWSMPHADVKARYTKRNIPMLNTADSGQISLVFRPGRQPGERWRVRRFREEIRPVWYLQQVTKD